MKKISLFTRYPGRHLPVRLYGFRRVTRLVSKKLLYGRIYRRAEQDFYIHRRLPVVVKPNRKICHGK